jgi:hypothetical protein
LIGTPAAFAAPQHQPRVRIVRKAVTTSSKDRHVDGIGLPQQALEVASPADWLVLEQTLDLQPVMSARARRS